MNSINKVKTLLKISNRNFIKIGMDIGGSLTKIVVALSNANPADPAYDKLNFRKNLQNNFEFLEELEIEDNYLFIRLFNTNNFNTEILDFLKKLNNLYNFSNISTIYATGGGAYKFFDVINDEFQIKMNKQDELMSLVKGYLIMNQYNTFYEFIGGDKKYSVVPPEDLIFPHLSVNIGSGVSILQVNDVNDIQRVSGTLMGGGTLIGLSKLLINVDNYNDILTLAEKGDNTNIDLLVKDIYGSKYTSSNLDLDPNTIASSFGKIHQLIQQGHRDKIRKEDIAKSLLVMICYHIAQLSYLLCKKNNINKVYYFGNFSRRNSYAIEWLDYATKFWNRELAVRFNIYDGFLGSIGSIVD